ncbi:MAG: flagellar hook protein FlgE [Candidatus Goldbacteria bacterium]|nr:flagellar hook protein FlgE [Candidatus Goldiibacteriota bacterium]
MMGSLFSSISGLKNHTSWMNVIGNNISNVNTVGFKMGRVTFKEAISQSLGSASGSNNSANLGGINPKQQGLGSTLGSIDTIMTQGAIQTTGNATDVAIDGAGFFVVESGDATFYTRAGNFNFDNDGNLTTSSGGLVQGWQREFTFDAAAVPPYTSVLDTNQPYTSIKIPQNMVIGPRMTSNSNDYSPLDKQLGIIIKGNLDCNTPMNTVGDPAGGYPLAGYTPDAVSTATVYDSLGTARQITFYWTQTADITIGPASWTWTAYDTTDPTMTIANGTAPIVGNSGPITFDQDGSLLDNGAGGLPTENAIITLNPTNGAYAPQVISVNIGTDNGMSATGDGLRDGVTGDYGSGTYDVSTGLYIPKQTIYTSFVDGYSEGTLTGVSIDQTGGINCSFSNNQIITMAQLAVANFANPAGLEKAAGTMFMQSANSGLAQVSTAGNAGLGTTTGAALEASNVDLSVELTNMIIAQRGFESNARIVTTSSDMLDTLVQLGR